MSEAGGTLPEGTKRWVEALSWHEILTEEDETKLTSSMIRDWQIWYADPENHRFFDDLSRVVEESPQFKQFDSRSNSSFAPDDYDPVIPIAEWRGRARILRASHGQPSFREKWWRWSTDGLAIIATVTLVIAMLSSSWSRLGALFAPGDATYRTAVGVLQEVHLNDGSDITLGGGTRLAVDLSKRDRSVRLFEGEAWFRVAHNPTWPFLVHAGDRTIKAVGTAFVVARESDRVVVTVTEGTVAITASRVAPLRPAVGHGSGTSELRPQPPIRVTRGEVATYGDNGILAAISRTDTHTAIAWTDGRLIFNDEPLRYVIESINRYFPRRISETPPVGKLRFSGVIFDGEIDEWLHGLPRIFPVDVDERGPGVCIHMPAGQASCDAAPKP